VKRTGPPRSSPRSDDAASELTTATATAAKQRRQLFSTFGYLVATPAATAFLGLGYWAITTHLFKTREVGIAAAAVSSASFLGLIGSLGIGTLLLAEIGSMDRMIRRSAVATGIAVNGAFVAVLAVATIALSPYLGQSLRAIGSDPVTAALLVGGAVATVAVTTFDNAAIGLHRGSAQLTRGILASVLKIICVVLLVVAGTRTSAGLMVAWAGGVGAAH
jgi:O-antigen/teichoic acid export membrane protein